MIWSLWIFSLRCHSRLVLLSGRKITLRSTEGPLPESRGGEGGYKCLAQGSRAPRWNSWVTVPLLLLHLPLLLSPPLLPPSAAITRLPLFKVDHTASGWMGACVFMPGPLSLSAAIQSDSEEKMLTLSWLSVCFSLVGRLVYWWIRVKTSRWRV